MPSKLPSLPKLPQLTDDPDARSLRAGWIASGLLLGLVVLWLWLGVAPTLAPFFALLAAAALLFPLWRLVRLVWQQIKHGPYEPWQGAYYEFDGQQIRILFDDEGQAWLAADDVLDVFGLQGHARDRERLRLIAGRDGLRAAPGTQLMCFTERGLRAWLERRTERMAGQFVHWLNTQVLAPHRRKRELAGKTTPSA
jgi:hypothetical protein